MDDNSPKQKEGTACSCNDCMSTEYSATLLSLVGARTIRRLRKMKNISQGKAALASDISQSYLSNVEQAKHILSFTKLFSLSQGIDIEPEECLSVYLNELHFIKDLHVVFHANRKDYSEYSSFSDYIKQNINKDLS